MNREALKKIPLRANPFQGLDQKIHRVLAGLFLVQFLIVWFHLWTGVPNFAKSRWVEGFLLVLCAATTIASLTRFLPGQNVMLASAIIAVVAGAAHSLSATIGVPFGPCVYTERIGQMLFYPLPWAIPVLWLVVVFNARGVARLIMRPWRKTRTYGFWVMGLTVALAVLLDLALEPFATQVKSYWVWGPNKAGLFWFSTPWVNFLGWAATTALILAFATPSLINKKPSRQHPVDFYPLIVWTLIYVLFLTGLIIHQLWPAVIVNSISLVVALVLAIKGGRW